MRRNWRVQSRAEAGLLRLRSAGDENSDGSNPHGSSKLDRVDLAISIVIGLALGLFIGAVIPAIVRWLA